MARTPDPSRKPELLERTLDYLIDKPLSSLTFRTLAKALGVSTYTLVYQFGTHSELVRDIVGAISARSSMIRQRLEADTASLDTYFEGLVISWQWTLEPRNRELQRLEFEAGLLEAVRRDELTSTRELYARWQTIGRDALVSFGLRPDDAEAATRLLVNTFHGIQYDLILNRDAAKATASFERGMAQHRANVEALLARSL